MILLYIVFYEEASTFDKEKFKVHKSLLRSMVTLLNLLDKVSYVKGYFLEMLTHSTAL